MNENLSTNEKTVEKIDSLSGNGGKHPDEKRPTHEKDVCLKFIVNGTPEKVEAKQNWHLRKAVEIVLKETGNEGRPLTDWMVKWNGKALDLDLKISQFDFPNHHCAELFLSLNAGQGGNSKLRLCK